MKPNIYQNRRNHNRNRNNNNNNNHNRVNILRQTLDSHGPSVRIRGNPSQICEKYLSMARDALSSGDPILAENLQQHADHYQRLINSAQQQNNERQERNNERRQHNRNQRQDAASESHQQEGNHDETIDNDAPQKTEATVINASAQDTQDTQDTQEEDDKIAAGQISFLSAGASTINASDDDEPIKVKKTRAKKAITKKTRARKLDSKLEEKVNTANSLA